jgi:hypothetical protein
LFSKKQRDSDSLSEAQESTAASFRTTVTTTIKPMKNKDPPQIEKRDRIEVYEEELMK